MKHCLISHLMKLYNLNHSRPITQCAPTHRARTSETMATQFSIDDAFVLDGEEEVAVSDGEREGWNSREKDREAAGEMTFGPLSFTKPQSHPSPAAAGSADHSNLKYQVDGLRYSHTHENNQSQ